MGSFVLLALSQTLIVLTPGLVIDRSGTVNPQVYELPASGDQPVVVVRGSNLTVDFTGTTMMGSTWETRPDQRKGFALQVDGENVTIKGLKAHGYKFGLIAKGAKGLKILDCDFSYNYKPQLKSTLEREDTADWMSYHQNEKDEWMRFGAGVYLRDVDNFEVKNVRIVGGQNGLMITNCNKGLIWNNSFSFLSAIGLGMYRSSENRIMHNNIDWCVRGYSHGRWNRGQDSSGILIYEQSNKNVFAYNSVTHGGDGFFLWAGQTTMDTGEGGCNDNLLYGNDFSHAPTNGIEATFSRNQFVNNLILECWHGIWGGYSYDSLVLGNIFSQNAEAIAWEHGQNNRVLSNLFFRDTAGIILWQKPSEDPNWGYPKKRDTRSRSWTIRGNEFNNISGDAIRLTDTTAVQTLANSFAAVGQVVTRKGNLDGFKFESNNLWVLNKAMVPTSDKNKVNVSKDHKPEIPLMRPDGNVITANSGDISDYIGRFNVTWAPYPTDKKPDREVSNDTWMTRYYTETRKYAPKPLPGGKRPFIKEGQIRGRRFILVDDWGPYDFKTPILWPRGEENGKLKLEVLGPAGQWRVVDRRGVSSVSKETGETLDTITVTLDRGKITDIFLELEFIGDAIRDRFGKPIPAKTPYRFRYSEFFAPIDWNVKLFNWDPAKVADPKAAMPKLGDMALGAPVKEFKTDRLEFASGGAFVAGGPTNNFATIADGTFTIDPGTYDLQVTTDDGIRVFVDDKLVLESWKYQGPTPYSTKLSLGGAHRIRVEHYEIDGYSALQLKLARG